jgi:hypothetical protein
MASEVALAEPGLAKRIHLHVEPTSDCLTVYSVSILSLPLPSPWTIPRSPTTRITPVELIRGPRRPRIEERRSRNLPQATFRHPRSLRKLHRTASHPSSMATWATITSRTGPARHRKTETMRSRRMSTRSLRKDNRETRDMNNLNATMARVSRNQNHNTSSKPRSRGWNGLRARTLFSSLMSTYVYAAPELSFSWTDVVD